MYLISVYFDEKTEQSMQSYINQVAKVTGNTFMLDGKIPPHITLLGLQGQNDDEIINAMDRCIGSMEKGDICFSAIGEFKGQVICAQPILNEYLHNLSQKVYSVYESVEGISFSPFYKPFSWIPHMSIGKHLNDKQMVEAFEYLIKKFAPIEAQVVRIGIAKTNPHRDIKVYDLMKDSEDSELI